MLNLSDPCPSIIKPSGIPEEQVSHGGELAAQVVEDGWQQRDSVQMKVLNFSPKKRQHSDEKKVLRSPGETFKRAVENRV